MLENLINKKLFLVKEKFDLVYKKYFFFFLNLRHFLKVMKK